MKIISFELTMPNRGSWNGKWSGEDRKYFIIRKFHEKLFKERYQDKLFPMPTDPNKLRPDTKGFYYRWEDGWGANVQAEIVESKEANKRRKISSGFCGYDWMVESILKHGKIYASHEEIPVLEEQKS